MSGDRRPKKKKKENLNSTHNVVYNLKNEKENVSIIGKDIVLMMMMIIMMN